MNVYENANSEVIRIIELMDCETSNLTGWIEDDETAEIPSRIGRIAVCYLGEVDGDSVVDAIFGELDEDARAHLKLVEVDEAGRRAWFEFV